MPNSTSCFELPRRQRWRSRSSARAPAVTLLKPRADSYSASHPTSADVLLVVQVAVTTLAFDLGTKVPLYGRYGVSEV